MEIRQTPPWDDQIAGSYRSRGSRGSQEESVHEVLEKEWEGGVEAVRPAEGAAPQVVRLRGTDPPAGGSGPIQN